MNKLTINIEAFDQDGKPVELTIKKVVVNSLEVERLKIDEIVTVVNNEQDKPTTTSSS